MWLGGQGHEPSAFPREINPVPILAENECTTMLGKNSTDKRKIYFLYIIHTPDGPTCTFDWENKKRIRNLWMEKKGLH